MKFSDICIITTDVIKLRTFYEKVFETIADGNIIVIRNLMPKV